MRLSGAFEIIVMILIMAASLFVVIAGGIWVRKVDDAVRKIEASDRH